MSFSKNHKKFQNVNNKYRHLIVLGAGASIAADNYSNGLCKKKLPSMKNLLEVVGLKKLVENIPSNFPKDDFEAFYSKLYGSSDHTKLREKIENKVCEYFQEMELPNSPTLYDYLILSLRSKDLIATFNWDPLLFAAFERNKEVADLPRLTFLHGNVSIGYNSETGESGPVGSLSKIGAKFHPTKLLYPVEEKDYNKDPFLKNQWSKTIKALSHAHIVTIFGYSAPKTDIAAMKLFGDAWGNVQKRNNEQFEIINIQDEKELRMTWNNFIHTHHYEIYDNFFKSRLARNPRRTGESYQKQFFPSNLDEFLAGDNKVPENFKTLKEMQDWFQPLIEAEKEGI